MGFCKRLGVGRCSGCRRRGGACDFGLAGRGTGRPVGCGKAGKAGELVSSHTRVAAQPGPGCGSLGETVDWFHHLTAGAEQIQIAGVDSVTRDKLHQQSLTAVSLAFDFGKACAALLNEQARQVVAATQGQGKGAADSNAPAGSVAGSKSPADTKGFAGNVPMKRARMLLNGWPRCSRNWTV